MSTTLRQSLLDFGLGFFGWFWWVDLDFIRADAAALEAKAAFDSAL
ncbi:MAG: hypothetical protein ACI85V_000339 [bacterium]